MTQTSHTHFAQGNTEYARAHAQTHLVFFSACVRVHGGVKQSWLSPYSQAAETDSPQCVHCLTRGAK